MLQVVESPLANFTSVGIYELRMRYVCKVKVKELEVSRRAETFYWGYSSGIILIDSFEILLR